MQTVKQIVHEIAERLPDQASIEDAMYALYVRQKLERSIRAAQEGKVTSQEEMEKKISEPCGLNGRIPRAMIWMRS